MSATIHDHPMRDTLERAHQLAQVRRFEVRTVSRDGRVTVAYPVGGSSCGHIVDALDRAGEGGCATARALS